jgi:hypothetical protein
MIWDLIFREVNLIFQRLRYRLGNIEQWGRKKLLLQQ